MTRFFKQYLKIMIAALFLVACVKAEKQVESPAAGQTVFRMGMSGEAVDVSGYSRDIFRSGNIQVVEISTVSVHDRRTVRLPNSRRYQLMLCISDWRTGQPVVGTRFEIHRELGPAITRTVEDDQCLHWEEVVDFDYLAEAVNLELNYVFKTTTSPRAYIHKLVRMNPWDNDRSDYSGFTDLTRIGISSSLRQQVWAAGPERVQQALAGQLPESSLRVRRRLVIGSVNQQLVDKRVHSFGVELSDEAPEFGPDGEDYLLSESSILSPPMRTMGLSLQDHREEVLRVRRQALTAQGIDEDRVAALTQSLDLDLQLRMQGAQVIVEDSSGQRSPVDLTMSGMTFKVEAQMLATDRNSSEPQLILTNNYFFDHNWKMSDDGLGLQAVIPLSIMMRPTWGNLALALKVTPVMPNTNSLPDGTGPLSSIEPFEALYYLGRFDQLASTGSVNFDLSEYDLDPRTGNLSFNYENYLQRADNYTEWNEGRVNDIAERSGVQRTFQRFEFGILNILFGRVIPGDTATDRTIAYTVETCINDAFTNRPIGPNNKFRIITEDRGVELPLEATTNPNGCLNWFGLISHKYFHREDLIRKISKIKFMGDESMPEYELDYYINPWDEKFTFGRDSRVLLPEYLTAIKEQQKNAPPSRLLITDFQYTTINFRYAIDKDLGLTVKKSVLMKIDPDVLKYNSIIYGRSGVQMLRDGVYLLKVALHKNYLDPAPRDVHHRIETDTQTGILNYTHDRSQQAEKEYLTVKEKLVRVLGGRIITPVQFEVEDLRLMRIRSNLLLQMETIDEGLLRRLALASDRLDELEGSTGPLFNEAITVLEDREANLAQLELISATITESDYDSRIAALNTESRERLRALFSSLDREAFNQTIATIDALRLREAPEHGRESTNLNMRYDSFNTIADTIYQSILDQYNGTGEDAGQDDDVGVRERALREFQANRREECLAQVKALKEDGVSEEVARRYRPGGELCSLNPSEAQMYYMAVTAPDAGSEEWLARVLTPEQHQAYRENNFDTDFAAQSYNPSYDLDLLSNEGDERNAALARNRYGLELTEENPVNNNVSGLAKRTFVGPITILKSDNASAMRPTDVLGEVDCPHDATCAELDESEIINIPALTALEERDVQRDVEALVGEALSGASEYVRENYVVRDFNRPVNADYDDSPFYGSVRHYRTTYPHVDDLIERKRVLDKVKEVENQFSALKVNFLDMFGLQYVSLTDETESVRDVNQDCYFQLHDQYSLGNFEPQLEDCMSEDPAPQVVPVADFLRLFEDNLRGDVEYNSEIMVVINHALRRRWRMDSEVNADELKEFFKNGIASKRLSSEKKFEFMHRMCRPLRNQVFAPSFVESVNGAISRATQESHNPAVMQSLTNGIYAELLDMVAEYEDTCHRKIRAMKNLVDEFVEDAERDFRRQRQEGEFSVRRAEITAFNNYLNQSPLVLERKVFVNKTTGKYFYKDGKSLNYNVGTNFNLSASRGFGRSRQIDPLGVLAGAISAGAAGAIAGAWGGVPGFIAGGAVGIVGSLVASYRLRWDVGDNLSESNGTSVSEGTYLAAQISTLDIELEEWEKCSVVRLDPEVIDGQEFGQRLNDFVSDAELMIPNFKSSLRYDDLSGYGFLLCSGDIDTVDDMPPDEYRGEEIPLRIRERYVYFTQHFTEGDMQDPASLVNHPWMLQLRGVRDYSNFVASIKGERGTVEQLTVGNGYGQMVEDMGSAASFMFMEERPHNAPPPFQVVDLNDLARPIDILALNYRKVLPTFPGVYTFIDASGERVTNWPTTEEDNPARSFE